MGGKSKAQTVGYHYRPAFHVGLVGRMIDAFLEYRAADKTAWAGELTASGRIQIDAPDLFGGEKDQGGIVGPVDVMFGEPDQLPNPYLVEAFGPQTAAWRGMTTLVFAGGRFGAMNPYQQKSAYKIRKILNGWDGGAWYPERAAIPVVPGTLLTSDLAFPATSASQGPYAGITFDEGFTAADTIIVEKPPGLTYKAYSYWDRDDNPLAEGKPWNNAFWVTDEHGRATWYWGGLEQGGGLERYATPEEAEAAVAGRFVGLGGSNSYTFWINDIPVTDNRGGLSLRVYKGGLLGINPAHLLYYVRTDIEKGAEPRASINDISLKAAADRLSDEGFGLCQVVYDPAQDTPDSMTERICRIIGGSFERSLVDGEWYLDLARGDYDLESLPVMGDDDILELKGQPTTLHGVTNSLSVRYFDPERKESVVTPAVRALGLIRAFGEIHETLDFPEIPTAKLALRVAERELRAHMTPSQGFELVSRPRIELLALRRSQYFRLQSPKRGIADMVCIVGEKDAGTLRSGAVRWKVAQDIYGLPETTYVEVEEGVDVRPPQIPVPIEHGRAFEAPYIDLVASLPRAELEALPSDVGFLLGVAARPGHGLDYAMAVRPEGAEFERVATGEWCPTATAEGTLDATAVPAVVPLAEVRGLDRVPVGAAVLVGDEIMRLDAKQLDPPQVTLARACADTIPHPHAAGARLWFLGDDVAVDVTEYAGGETVDVKLLPRTGSHQLPLDDAATLQVVFKERQARPYPPANVQVGGQWPPPAIVAGDIEITLAHRDRVLQADQLVAWDAVSTGPEAGVEYVARVFDDADALVHESDPFSGDQVTVNFEFTGPARLQVVSLRDGMECWQIPEGAFYYVGGDQPEFAITGTLPPATIGVPYYGELTVSGAIGEVAYSLIAGALPPGLQIDHDASSATKVVITGTPE